MLGFRSTIDKRILKLLSVYANLRSTYGTKGEEYVLRELLGDMQVRGGRMRERVDVHGVSLEPFADSWFLDQPLTLDRVLSWIIGWEFPDNHPMTVENIRQGTDPLTQLQSRIDRLKRQHGDA